MKRKLRAIILKFKCSRCSRDVFSTHTRQQRALQFIRSKVPILCEHCERLDTTQPSLYPPIGVETAGGSGHDA